VSVTSGGAVGLGVAVASGGAVGLGVRVGFGVEVGLRVAVGLGGVAGRGAAVGGTVGVTFGGVGGVAVAVAEGGGVGVAVADGRGEAAHKGPFVATAARITRVVAVGTGLSPAGAVVGVMMRSAPAGGPHPASNTPITSSNPAQCARMVRIIAHAPRAVMGAS
jgi:hypothetical protein